MCSDMFGCVVFVLEEYLARHEASIVPKNSSPLWRAPGSDRCCEGWMPSPNLSPWYRGDELSKRCFGSCCWTYVWNTNICHWSKVEERRILESQQKNYLHRIWGIGLWKSLRRPGTCALCLRRALLASGAAFGGCSPQASKRSWGRSIQKQISRSRNWCVYI